MVREEDCALWHSQDHRYTTTRRRVRTTACCDAFPEHRHSSHKQHSLPQPGNADRMVSSSGEGRIHNYEMWGCTAAVEYSGYRVRSEGNFSPTALFFNRGSILSA